MTTKSKYTTLVTAAQIAKRVTELAKDIAHDLPDGELVVVGVLKGSFIFMADLIRAIRRPLSCDFLRAASYESDRSTGVVRLEFDLTQSIENKNVLLVEDIVDSGRTLRYLLKHLQAKKPAKLRVASLLYKELHPELRSIIDYVGFTIPDKYVFGYGLDTEGMHRSLPDVVHW